MFYSYTPSKARIERGRRDEGGSVGSYEGLCLNTNKYGVQLFPTDRNILKQNTSSRLIHYSDTTPNINL